MIFFVIISCDQKNKTVIATTAEINKKDCLPQADTNRMYEYILFGMFCGECGSHCATMFQYNMIGNATTLLADYTDSYFEHKDNVICKTPIKNVEKMHLANSIVEKIPVQLLTTSQHRFGCPDCTDGCGIYFEFSLKGKVKKFTIDTETSKLSPDMKSFSEFLQELITEMKK
ncbi:MAG: hypothetical protein ABI402_13990 [Ferruginibacter sp.]